MLKWLVLAQKIIKPVVVQGGRYPKCLSQIYFEPPAIVLIINESIRFCILGGEPKNHVFGFISLQLKSLEKNYASSKDEPL